MSQKPDYKPTLNLPRTEFPMQALLGDEKFWLVFLFIPPLLTMRLLAEERGTGTLESLMTAPIRDWQVVAGKYVAIPWGLSRSILNE